MKNETLKQIINQIKKYDLTESFSNDKEFRDWVSKLNNTQIKNFLSLDIDLKEIENVRHLLINTELLNCRDYKQKVYAISTLKNGEGCWHLFDVLCKPNFLRSKNFYKDIEMLSKADTARYGLWILAENAFINSPYHDEDLKLLVETHDTNQDNPLDFIVSDALATVACNIDSIKSPYHQEDMKLISLVGSESLQMSCSYPEQSINNLAINKVSLSDKYHLENMKILAKNPISSEFLYIIMTDPKHIKGKYYKEEIEALVNAKSKLTARALYYYIANPKRKFNKDNDFYEDYGFDIYKADIESSNCISGNNDPNYIYNLKKINQIDDYYVMHYVSLLMNQTFMNSEYKNFDLYLLENISDKLIYMDLYYLMTNEDSLNSHHHKKDAIIISQTKYEGNRDLLLQKACDEYSLKNINHEFDMQFISRLNLNSIKENIYDEIYYYLYNEKGMDDLQHREKLDKLLQGVLVERSNSVSRYLDYLENQIDNNVQIIESKQSHSFKPKFKILNLFKKY